MNDFVLLNSMNWLQSIQLKFASCVTTKKPFMLSEKLALQIKILIYVIFVVTKKGGLICIEIVAIAANFLAFVYGFDLSICLLMKQYESVECNHNFEKISELFCHQ